MLLTISRRSNIRTSLRWPQGYELTSTSVACCRRGHGQRIVVHIIHHASTCRLRWYGIEDAHSKAFPKLIGEKRSPSLRHPLPWSWLTCRSLPDLALLKSWITGGRVQGRTQLELFYFWRQRNFEVGWRRGTCRIQRQYWLHQPNIQIIRR